MAYTREYKSLSIKGSKPLSVIYFIHNIIIMRYDDYQSLVKLYKRAVNRDRFSFLERRYKRLKKRGHPRTYIKIRKPKNYKPVLFDLNPFLEFSRKKEKWKNYFLVWYELAVYIKTQLSFWSSIKTWKYFHLRRRMFNSFGLNLKWYRLMSFFYDYRFMKSFYNINFFHYSNYLSRSRLSKLRRFVKKYIKSLRWESKILLRKLRRFKYKNKKRRFHVPPKKRLRLSFINKLKYIVIKYLKYKGLKSSMSLKEKKKYDLYKDLFKSYFSKGDTLSSSNKIYIRFVKKLKSRTFRRFFRTNYTNSIKSKRFIKGHHLFGNKWYSHKRKIRSYRLNLSDKIYSTSRLFSIGLSSTIKISKITPSLRYGLMSLVFLSNNGKYRDCSPIANTIKSLTSTDNKVNKESGVLLKKICFLLENRKYRSPKKKLNTRKYNLIKNRRFALSKISIYMKRRPLLLPVLSRFVLSYRKKLALDLLKYKYLKSTLNDYERDSYRVSIMRRIKKLKFYRRKLKRMRRSLNRVRRLAGTLKSWFILRLTSRYRKIIIRLRKYMKVFTPLSRIYPWMSKWNPQYNNYLFFMVVLYIMRKNYFIDTIIKPYIIQVMFILAYLNKGSLSNKIIQWKYLNSWNSGNYSLWTHYLVYLHA